MPMATHFEAELVEYAIALGRRQAPGANVGHDFAQQEEPLGERSCTRVHKV